MAAVAEAGRVATLVEHLPPADPAPLGLAGFALTTFLLSGHNAGFIPDVIWIGPALFYGGLAQLTAGMWEFRNRNVFGSTAFSTYGGFWLSLGIFVVLISTTGLGTKLDVDSSLAWFLGAFAIFNTYMMIWSLRTNVAVFLVFLVLDVTEWLLMAGFFTLAHGGSDTLLKAGGWAGVVTAALAWYTSAAGVVNGMSPGKGVVPVGPPLWGVLPGLSKLGSPLPRRTEG